MCENTVKTLKHMQRYMYSQALPLPVLVTFFGSPPAHSSSTEPSIQVALLPHLSLLVLVIAD